MLEEHWEVSALDESGSLYAITVIIFLQYKVHAPSSILMPTPQKKQVAKTMAEQKTAEEVLRQVELIVENSHDAIIGETLDGVITSWNGGAKKMFGYSAAEAIGKSSQFLHPKEKQGEGASLMKRIAAGEFVADYDTIRVCKDGSLINVGLSISPVKTEAGKIIGASIVERDITARKKEEESLRQIQLIVENSHDAIIGETLDGIITNWNGGAEKMFNYLSREVIGQPMSDLSPVDLKDESPRLLTKVGRGEVIADYDTVWLRKDQTTADVEFSMSPLRNQEGKIIGASLVGREITERKKHENRVKELNEVRNKFISIISHQLRTPLTAVNWNLEMLLNGDFGKLEETTRKFLHVTHHSSVEITRRIHDLLVAMDIEEGRIRIDKEEVALDSITAAIVTAMMKKCELKNITCQYIAPQNELPPIEIDNEKIRTVIMKIMENAIIYTNEKGKVTATLEKKGHFLRFEVKDTGVGVPEQEKHHVFNRFFRASNASTMQPDAFGLGLFISKNFIEQHGGTIGFESKEGEGSTFWFELPQNSDVKASK